jgi:molybdopterin/thiamine biosynthesis adenylyltransferase
MKKIMKLLNRLASHSRPTGTPLITLTTTWMTMNHTQTTQPNEQAALFATSERANLRLRLGPNLYQTMRGIHLAPGKQVEALSYAFARSERTADGWVILLPDDAPYFPFGKDCYDSVSAGNVRLNKAVLNGLLVEFAASDYNCLVNIHDHWFAKDAVFSGVDDADDIRFDHYLRRQFEPMLVAQPQLGRAREIHNVSIVLSQNGLAARMTKTSTKVLDEIQKSSNTKDTSDSPVFNPIHRVQRMGEQLQFLSTGERELSLWPTRQHNALADIAVADTIHTRHTGFFSAAHQAKLATLTVALVGCGGLGSILGEALVRSGFKSLVLIDDDTVSASNLNRWQGALLGDVGMDKTALLAQRLQRMAQGVSVQAMNCAVFDTSCLPALAGADMIIGGLDNDLARYFLSHVSAQFMVPYFDAGALIVTQQAAVDFKGRYFAQIPCVTGCIECKPLTLFDKKAVSYALANASTAAALRHAGYLDTGDAAPAPSAYALNLKVSATLMLEVLNYVTAWRALATVSAESWRTASAQRCDRDNMSEHPVEGCALCGVRTGMGTVFDLPKPNGAALTVDKSDAAPMPRSM